MVLGLIVEGVEAEDPFLLVPEKGGNKMDQEYTNDPSYNERYTKKSRHRSQVKVNTHKLVATS